MDPCLLTEITPYKPDTFLTPDLSDLNSHTHFMIPILTYLYTTISIYCTTSKRSNAFQDSERNRFPIWYSKLDPKEELPLTCSCQHGDIIIVHAFVLDLACNDWWKMWLVECSAVILYSVNVLNIFRGYFYPIFLPTFKTMNCGSVQTDISAKTATLAVWWYLMMPDSTAVQQLPCFWVILEELPCTVRPRYI